MKKVISYIIIAPFWLIGEVVFWALSNIFEDEHEKYVDEGME